ncbi:unnamed protein product [Schistocephalus solidus]|uniref:Lysosome membrane protein 2 n=1 Tax=Schistocephalus solidus TaxID=70667 RepID=A0A0X3PJP7_SCHSO|nr:unnamed protein product [Schistocephalus solidus]
MPLCHTCLISTVILLLGIGIGQYLRQFTAHEIIKRVTLTNDSVLFKSWASAPTSSLIKFYFFIVSNAKQFSEGEIPIVTLRGPYTYAQVTTKEGITFNKVEGTIQFTEKQRYVFMPELSNGTESDVVAVVNLAYLALVDKVSNYPQLLAWILELLELHYGSDLFLNRTVDQLIWGYEDPVLKEIGKVIPVSPSVGIMTNGNNSFGENFTIHDGVSDIEKLGKIVSYNGEVSLNIWGTMEANQINGSDGSLFPPFLKEGVTQYVFAGDICRSLEFESRGFYFVHGVPTLNFQLSDKVLLSPDANPANRGFCVNYPNCLKSGVLDMRTCMPNTPIVISLPHFNQADQSYRDGVAGMAPTEDMTIKVHVEPQTGVVMQAQKMIQVNAVIRRDERFRWLAKVRDTVLPVVYLNGTTTVSEEVALHLKQSLLWPQVIFNTLSAFLILGGSVGLLISAYQAIRLRKIREFSLAGGEYDPLL